MEAVANWCFSCSYFPLLIGLLKTAHLSAYFAPVLTPSPTSSPSLRHLPSTVTMLQFCPLCANILLVEHHNDELRLFCQTCPFVYKMQSSHKSRVVLQKKEVDDVFGGEEAWENADTARTTCPNCGHAEAYFMQIQTRSADEPSTIFYRCCKCHHEWKED
uniref:DNA-directed RNA polymerase III subunit RPC10 n=1 Tax=Palpitomonas bilix TaxID=652834 RepID=A0A7S3GG99_9EUKA